MNAGALGLLVVLNFLVIGEILRYASADHIADQQVLSNMTQRTISKAYC